MGIKGMQLYETCRFWFYFIFLLLLLYYYYYYLVFHSWLSQHQSEI